MRFTRQDLVFSVITGLTTGFSVWRILIFVGQPEIFGISAMGLMVLVPILWILGVNLGYFLGRWFSFFIQFGKFSAIGFTNAAVDFGILNFLIYFFKTIEGGWFSIFKGVSFMVAVIHSYFWNKRWSFKDSQGNSRPAEFAKFFAVAIASTVINVFVASVVNNLIGPQFDLPARTWANLSAVAGSAAALIGSFLGFKLIVFKK